MNRGKQTDANLKLTLENDILRALKKRLVEHRADKALVFDAVTLPDGEPGKPGAIMDLIKTNFKSGTLKVEDAPEPELDEKMKTLTVAGKIMVNGKAAISSAVFTVSERLEKLELTLKLALHSGWFFSDSFPTLKDSVLDYLYLCDSTLYLVSCEGSREGVFFPLKAGLNFQGVMKVSSSLQPITEKTEDIQKVTYGGPIDYVREIPEFVLAGQAPLANLAVKPHGMAPMDMREGHLVVSSKPDGEGKSNIACVIRGTVSWAACDSDIAFDLDVPNRKQNRLLMRQAKDKLSLKTIGAVAKNIGGTELAEVLPVSLSGIPSLEVTGLACSFDPAGKEHTAASVSITNGSTVFPLIREKISIRNLVFKLDVHYYPYFGGQTQKTFSGMVQGTFDLGKEPVTARIVIPSRGDWLVSVTPDKETPVLDVVAGWMGEEAQNILKNMPEYIREMTNLSLKNITVSANPFTPSLEAVSFCLTQVGTWRIIPDILEIYNWTVDTKIARQTEKWRTTALLRGKICLGKKGNGVEVNVNLPIPAGTQGWKLSLADGGVHIPSLEHIFHTAGLDSVNEVLPAGIRKLGNIDVSVLEFVFNPSRSPVVESVAFMMSTTEAWEILSGKNLSIEKLQTGFTLFNTKKDGVYAVGYIRGAVKIFKNDLFLSAQKTSRESPWQFTLDTLRPIHIPGLNDLAGWMLPGEVTKYIPDSFMPFKDGFELLDLGMEFDLSATKLDMLRFKIVNSGSWEILPGYLKVDKAMVEAKFDKPFQQEQGLACLIEAVVYICGCGIKISGDKSSSKDKWKLSGSLEDKIKIDFQKLFAQMKLEDISLPDIFPKELDLVKADVRIVPEDKKFNFEVETDFDWIIKFGPATLSILAVRASLDINEEEIPRMKNYLFKAKGNFKFCGLDGYLGFTVSNRPSEDTILEAEIEAENAGSLSLRDLANSLTEDPNLKWDKIPIPKDTKIPVFAALNLYVNLTKKIFMVCGHVRGLGKAGFLAQKVKIPKIYDPEGPGLYPLEVCGDPPLEEKWAYLVVAALAEDFKFANIHSSLKDIDGWLTIKDAGFVISSFPADSLKDVVSKAPQLEGVLPTNMPDGPVEIKPGALLFCELDFNGKLSGNIIKVGDDLENKLKIRFYAFMDRECPENTKFCGSVNEFTILKTVTFSDVQFSYWPNKPREFQLKGTMKIRYNEYDYKIEDNLMVYEERAIFKAATKETTIEKPLGIAGLTIEELHLAVEYRFKGRSTGRTPETAEAWTKIMLGGKIGLGKKENGQYPVELEGDILFNGGKAQVVDVSLVKPLTVDQLFACIFPEHVWPVDFLKITFCTGKFYYCGEDCTLFEYKYFKGFYLDTTIDIYGLVFHVAAQVYKEGIKIEGNIPKPIDLDFLRITDGKDGQAGPGVYIETGKGIKKFGGEAGLCLFGENFGVLLGGDTKKHEFTGEFSYKGSVKMLEGSVSFAWNKENGFRITSWPMKWETAALKYAELIRKASRSVSPQCGEIVGWATKEIITTKFGIMSKLGKGDSPGCMGVILTVKYDVDVAGTNIISGAMPDMKVNIPFPKKLSFSALAETIMDTITINAVTIFEQIFSDNEKLAKFVAAITLTEGAKKIAENLICRGIKNIKGGGKTGDDWLDDAEKAVNNIAKVAGLAAAASAAAAAISAGMFAFPLFVAAIIFFTALVAAIAYWLGIESEEQKKAREQKEEAERKKKKAEGIRERAITAMRAKLEVHNLNAWFERPKEQVQVSWDKVKDDDVGVNYSVKAYLNNETEPLFEDSFTGTKCNIVYSSPGRNILTVKVTAYFFHEGERYEGNAAEKILSIEILLSPADLKVEQVCEHIAVSWQPGDAITKKFNLLALREGIVYQARNIMTLNHEVSHEYLKAGEKHAVQVTGCTDESESKPAEAVITYVSMAAPSDLRYMYIDRRVEKPYVALTWKGNAGSVGYAVEVYSEKGILLEGLVINITGNCAIIEGKAIAAGSTCFIRTGAQNEDKKQTVWSEKIKAPIESLDIPSDILPQYSEQKLAISWQQVAGAQSYKALLLDAGGAPVKEEYKVDYDKNSAVIHGYAFKEQDIYMVAVMGFSTHTESDRGFSPQVRVFNLPVPGGPMLFYKDSKLKVSWSKVDTAESYCLKLTEASTGKILKTVENIAKRTEEVLDIALKSGERYTVALRAVKGFSRSAEAVRTLTLLPAPGLTELYYQDEKVCAAWKQMEGALAYGFRLLKENGDVVKVLEGLREIAAQVGGGGIVFADGEKYYAQARSEAADQTGDWGEKQSIGIAILEVPGNIRLDRNAERKLLVAWDAVPRATAYRFQLLDRSGKPVGNAAGGLQGTSYVLDPAGIPYEKGAVFYASIRGETSQSRGAWGKSKEIVQLNRADIKDVCYLEGKVEIRWNPLPGAEGYLLQVLGKGNNVEGEMRIDNGGAVYGTVDVPGIGDGKYSGRVRAFGGGYALDGPWSDEKAFHLLKISIRAANWRVDKKLEEKGDYRDNPCTRIEGCFKFGSKTLSGVNPGDALAVRLVFTDPFFIGGNPPPDVTVLVGESSGSKTWGAGYRAVAAGTLEIKASDAGVVGERGTLKSFWMNFKADDPRPGQKLNTLSGCFVVPDKLNDTPIKDGQQLSIQAVCWETLMQGDQREASLPIGEAAFKPGKPVIVKLAYQEEAIHVQWGRVSNARLYDLELLDAEGKKTIKAFLGLADRQLTLDCQQLKLESGASYKVHVRAAAEGVTGSWSDVKSITLSEVQERALNLANELKARGKKAQEAGPIIKNAFPVLTAANLAKILSQVYEEAAGNALELAWCLKACGYGIVGSAPAIKTVLPGMDAAQMADVLVAVFETPAKMTLNS